MPTRGSIGGAVRHAILLFLGACAAATLVHAQGSSYTWAYNASWAVSEPVIVTGTVVWATKDYLIGASAATGQVAWTQNGNFSAPARVGKTHVAAANLAEGTVSLFVASVGQVAWSVDVLCVGLQPPVVSADGRTVVVLSTNGLVGIDVATADVLWTNPDIVGDGQARLTGCGSTVYVAIYLQALYVVSATTGNAAWNKSFPVMFAPAPIDSAEEPCRHVAVALSKSVPPGSDPTNIIMGYETKTGRQAFDIPPHEYFDFTSPVADGVDTLLVPRFQFFDHVLIETHLSWYRVSNTSAGNIATTSFDFSGLPTHVPELDLYVIGTYTTISAYTHLRENNQMSQVWQVYVNGYVDHAPAVSVSDNIVAVRDDKGYMYAMPLTAATASPSKK